MITSVISQSLMRKTMLIINGSISFNKLNVRESTAQMFWITGSNLPQQNYDTNFTIPLELESTYPVIKYTITAGSLPEGLYLSQDGYIFGKYRSTNSSELFEFSITAYDLTGYNSERDFELVIKDYSSNVYWITMPEIDEDFGLGQGVYSEVEAESEFV